MKAKIKRVLLVARVFAHGLLQGAWWLVGMWVIGIVLFTLFVAWDGRVVVWCGIPQEPLAGAGSQEAMTRLLLCEFFCWGWVAVSLFYSLPNVLLPLATSHSISQVLWLRMTPTTAGEMAVARVCRLLLASTFLGLLGGTWIVICTTYHSVNVLNVLPLVGGFLTHMVVSGGLVLFFTQWAKSDKARIVIAFISLILPWLSCLVYFVFRREGDGWSDWWPYASPFTYFLLKDDKHLISCALLGLALVATYVSAQRGQVVLHVSHANSEICL